MGDLFDIDIKNDADCNAKPALDFNHGHRKRLRARFFNAGADALYDYELLEMVLFLVHRRKDTKPLAKQLLKEFHTFHGVLSADRADLLRIKGVGDALVHTLKTIEAAGQRMARSKLDLKRSIERTSVASWQHLIEYCQSNMTQHKIEAFHVLFLDRKNYLIKHEVMSKGTIDHVAVYPREVMKRALELNANALILAHNHPSGDPTPSEADINMTGQIQQAANFLRMRLHDHLIVGKDQIISLHDMGYC